MSDTNGKLVSRGKLFEKSERRYVETDIEGLGRCRLQSLTAGEYTSIELRTLDDEGGVDTDVLTESYAYTITLMLVDEKNKRILTEADIDDLLELDASIIRTIYRACEAHIENKPIEGVVKNSPVTGAAA